MKPRHVVQAVLTFLVVVIGGFIRGRIHENYNLIRGAAAVDSLNSNNPVQIAKANDTQNHDYSGLVWLVVIALVALIWTVPYILSYFEGQRVVKRAGMFMLLALGIPILLTACDTKGPAYYPYTINSSETAYLVSASDTSKQAQFESEAYLNANKVSTRQVTISFSRYVKAKSNGGDEYDYKADNILILVDRSPVTRLWTQDTKTGTSSANEAFHLETNEAIDFTLGGTCTGNVTPENASKFLFNFANGAGSVVKDDAHKFLPDAIYKLATVDKVMDSNVHGAFQARLFADVHSMGLEEVRKNIGTVFAKASTDITKDFEARGLTLSNCGGQGGITFNDAKVQDAINQTFITTQANLQRQQVAQSAQIEAQNQFDAQQIQNKTLAAKAEGQAAADKIQQDRETAFDTQLGELAKKYPDLATLILAQKWNGTPPQYVSGNSSAPYVQVPGPSSTATPAGPPAPPKP